MGDALDDLIVYQEAVAAEKEIVAILGRLPFGDFRELREQMGETCARVPRHIQEGHGQMTDRHFAHFVFLARGEAREMLGHLSSAHVRRCISDDEHQHLARRYTGIAKMLSSLGRHLHRENRKFRA